MSTHQATVSAIYAAFGRGDIPAILEHLAEDVAWEEWADNTAQRAGVPWLQARHGRAGVAEFFALMSQLRVNDFQLLGLLASADQVAAEVVIDVTIPDLGRHYRDEEIHLWSFDQWGKVRRLRHYTDTAKHLAAAQPSRHPAPTAVAERFYAAGADPAIDEQLIADDIVYHGPPMIGEQQGRAAFSQIMERFRTGFPGFTTSIEALVTEGDLVTVRHTHHGRHTGPFNGLPPTNREIHVQGIEILRIRDGRIAELWHLDDWLTLLQQLGVAP